MIVSRQLRACTMPHRNKNRRLSCFEWNGIVETRPDLVVISSPTQSSALPASPKNGWPVGSLPPSAVSFRDGHQLHQIHRDRFR